MELSYLLEKYIEKTGYGMDMWSKEENAVMTTIAEILEESKVKKFSISDVISSVCVSCDEEKETHEICMDCISKMIKENKTQTDL
jgi:ribosomal protein L32